MSIKKLLARTNRGRLSVSDLTKLLIDLHNQKPGITVTYVYAKIDAHRRYNENFWLFLYLTTSICLAGLFGILLSVFI